jgi:lipopolysaccharide/colanic/teichoic acid biosynthesis glycosyltransferase
LYRYIVKPLLDFLLALVLLPVLLLLLIPVGLWIRREDQGPVFYRSLRLGQQGRTFFMYKFRTMQVNAPDLRNPDGSTFNAEDDPRLTRIGRILRKTSLDELPQIFNVLRGEMSFIGPRPDLPGALGRYTDIERRKLEVRPGISGYSQAYSRNAASMQEKFAADVYYVEHLSLGMDFKILVKTLDSVIRRKNIYSA